MIEVSRNTEKTLLRLFPSVAAEWHPTLNAPLTPECVTAGSQKKVWWECSVCQHQWQAFIGNRTGLHSGCPVCHGSTKFLARYNERREIIRGLLGELDYNKYPEIDATCPKLLTNSKYWWKCNKCGSSWLASLEKRISGRGCSYCAGSSINNTNSLAALAPNVAAEWHPHLNNGGTPESVTSRSGKRAWWLCPKCGNEWETAISSRTAAKTGCPVCSLRNRPEVLRLANVKRTGNYIADNAPQLIDEWDFDKNHPHTPETVSVGSSLKIWWKCQRGHSWQVSPSNRTQKGGTGCPECAFGWQTSKIEVRIFAEFSKLFHDLIWRHKIDGIEFDFFVPSCHLAIEIDGYFWHKDKTDYDKQKNAFAQQLGVTLIRIRDTGLEPLSNNDLVMYLGNQSKVVFSLVELISNRLEETNPLKDQLQDYLLHKRFKSDALYRDIASNLPAPQPEDSFAASHPDIALEWDKERNFPLTPFMFKTASNHRAHWICRTVPEHKWSTAIGNRTGNVNKTGCPFCADIAHGKRSAVTSIRKNGSISEIAPLIAKEWDFNKNGGQSPVNIPAQSNKYFWWRCEKGHSWRQQVIQRVRRGYGCPECSLENRSMVLRSHHAKKRGSIENETVAKFWCPERNAPLSPQLITPKSKKMLWWVCPTCSIAWKATVKTARGREGICPKCRTTH